MDDHRKPLAPGHIIAGYSIVRAIGQGGFGIVYEAVNPYTKDRAAIKQFYPNNISSWRHDTIIVEKEDDRKLVERILKRFEGEAAVQASYDHPNILKVKNFIRENNTGYLFTEFIDGMTLLDHVEQYGSVFPDERMFRTMLEPISDAIGYIHEKHTLHLDIAPDNILVDKSGRPVLVDFGAAKHDLRRERSLSTIVQYKPDYAPVEQAEPSAERPEGRYTDIFALAGTMYRLLSGTPPERVIKRALSVRDPYVPIGKVAKTKCPDAVYRAIDRGLSLAAADRPQTIEEFVQSLGWRGATARSSPPQNKPAPRPEPDKAIVEQRKPRNIAGYATVLFLVLGVVAGLVLFSGGNKPIEVRPPSSPPPTTTQAVSPSPSPSASAAPAPSVAPTRPSPSSTQAASLPPSPSATSTPSLAPSRPISNPAPPAVASPPAKAITAPPVAAKPASDATETEERLYQDAKSCLGSTVSCNLEGCLRSYQDNFGSAERYQALKAEYLNVMRSPRCRPPSQAPIPVVTPTPVETQPPVHAATPAPAPPSSSVPAPASTPVPTPTRSTLAEPRPFDIFQSAPISGAKPPQAETPPPAQTSPPAQASPPVPPLPPPPRKVSYATYPNADMEGGDLPGPPQLYGEQSACEQACTEATSPECVGYAYDKWIKACYLKQSLTQLRLDPESSVVVRSTSPRLGIQPGPVDIEAAGFRFNDTNNTPYASTSSPSRKACSQLCRSENACLGYQYEKSVCSRYDRLDTAAKDAKAQSGVKRQIAPNH